MKTIVLSTLNARYSHASLGLRYLFANLKNLQDCAHIMEFTIQAKTDKIVEDILENNPQIVGFGVYIWNALETQKVIHMLKKVAPAVHVIVGGPEVSHRPLRVDFEADYVIPGEADLAFYSLCHELTQGKRPQKGLYAKGLPQISDIASPYRFYSDHDLAQRVTYVEASRGCPFTCEFCLSSLDQKVRKFDTSAFLKDMEELWRRGARNFKFIDRTFNLSPKTTSQILDYFLNKQPTPFFVHFEMIPDHFPPFLKEKLSRFEPATLQLEIGIQSLNPDVTERIRRKLNPLVIEENLRFLSQETQAHLHLDLIVGLPGEDLDSFGQNLNRLVAWAESEVQIGILKKLSGTDLSRHDADWDMLYSDFPPYEILQNKTLSFQDMQRMKRFARFWDLVYNSGNFKQSVTLLWTEQPVFDSFLAFSDWLYAQTQSTHQLALNRLAKLFYEYLTEVCRHEANQVGPLMVQDLGVNQGRPCPPFLRGYQSLKTQVKKAVQTSNAIKRQMNHAQ